MFIPQGAGDDSDDDDEYDEAEETPLESYETPLDKEDCAVDEYQVFKAILESKSPSWLFVCSAFLRYVLSSCLTGRCTSRCI